MFAVHPQSWERLKNAVEQNFQTMLPPRGYAVGGTPEGDAAMLGQQILMLRLLFHWEQGIVWSDQHMGSFVMSQRQLLQLISLGLEPDSDFRFLADVAIKIVAVALMQGFKPTHVKFMKWYIGAASCLRRHDHPNNLEHGSSWQAIGRLWEGPGLGVRIKAKANEGVREEVQLQGGGAIFVTPVGLGAEDLPSLAEGVRPCPVLLRSSLIMQHDFNEPADGSAPPPVGIHGSILMGFESEMPRDFNARLEVTPDWLEAAELEIRSWCTAGGGPNQRAELGIAYDKAKKEESEEGQTDIMELAKRVHEHKSIGAVAGKHRGVGAMGQRSGMIEAQREVPQQANSNLGNPFAVASAAFAELTGTPYLFGLPLFLVADMAGLMLRLDWPLHKYWSQLRDGELDIEQRIRYME
jgi:hypothetical protein